MPSLENIAGVVDAALDDSSMLTLTYMKADGDVSERIVTPTRYCDDGMQTVLVFDHGVQEPRSLKVDRILSAERTGDALAETAADADITSRLLSLGRCEVVPDHGQVTLNWAFTPAGAHMTVTKPSLGAAVDAAVTAGD